MHPMPTLQSITLILVILQIESHHVTTDLATLALHKLYTTSDNAFICDGISLSIVNIGTFTLTSLPTPLLFTNVLHVPAMSTNLILVSSLCANNPINILFFLLFQVQDHHTGVTLVREQRRDGVYYWPKSIPLRSFALVLSSLVWSSFSSISMWYSRQSSVLTYFSKIFKCFKYFLSQRTFMFLFL